MKKELLETIDGTIENIFLPDVWKDGVFIEEDYIDIIGFNIKTQNGNLKIIEKENNINLSLFKGDNVKINKYLIVCDYNNYEKKIKDLINLYFSNYSDKEKENEYNKYFIPIDKYNLNPKKIIEYEIVGK